MKVLTYEMCLQYINTKNEMELHEDSAEYHYDEKLDNTHDKIFRDLLSDEEEAINQEKAKSSKYKCPEVVLIVLYTGNEKWNVETEYKKITDKEFNYETNGTNSIYNLIDIHNYEKHDLIRGESIIEKTMAIEKCKTEEELIETLKEVISVTKDEKNKEKIRRIIQYILSPIIGREETQILLNKLKEEEKNMAGMLLTNLMEERRKLIAESEERGIKLGEERGKKRGRIEGNREGIIYVAKQMLKEQMEIEKIAKITKLKEEEIEKLKEELANA